MANKSHLGSELTKAHAGSLEIVAVDFYGIRTAARRCPSEGCNYSRIHRWTAPTKDKDFKILCACFEA